MTPSTITDELLVSRPNFHNIYTCNLVPDALRFIERNVRPEHRTLETGAGFSTITFAATGSSHTTIVHAQSEVDRIRAYCEQHDISHAQVTFIVGWTERTLPGLELSELDLILLDGSHAFPGVFIEWFYTAEALKVGGHLILDDIHLWTGRTLRDFLRGSPGWEQLDEFRGRTALFRKTGETQLNKDWGEQPYVYKKSLGVGGLPIKVRQAVSMLRHGQARALLEEAGQAVRRARS